MDQLQFTGDESTSAENFKAKLNFNHPVKEIVWVVQPNSFTSGDGPALGKQWFNFTTSADTTLVDSTAVDFLSRGGRIPVGGENPVVRAKIQLNGHDRLKFEQKSIQPITSELCYWTKSVEVSI